MADKVCDKNWSDNLKFHWLRKYFFMSVWWKTFQAIHCSLTFLTSFFGNLNPKSNDHILYWNIYIFK